MLSTNAFSQKILAFDKSGKVKRIRYYEGEYISLQTISKEKIKGIITQIKDSTFSVEGQELALFSVAKVYNTQKGMGYQLMANIFIIPAIGYIPLITINGLINNDSPVFRENQLYYGGGFIGIALMSNYLGNRPFRISKKRPFKIIDISI
ncbi:MAG: hypothetical protein ACJAV5_000214 [Vicingaceae bacterium]|jgi:hypothetical protein